jgi:hypothetical protein
MTMVCLVHGRMQQIPNTYSHYADPVMETLLVKVLPVMAQETGLQLVPTYSYARII